MFQIEWIHVAHFPVQYKYFPKPFFTTFRKLLDDGLLTNKVSLDNQSYYRYHTLKEREIFFSFILLNINHIAKCYN